MLLRSFLQLMALLLFTLVSLTVALLVMAYAGLLGASAHAWVEWGLMKATENADLIQKAFALVGASATLMISALGVYKTWRFAELNLPVRLEEMSKRWRNAVLSNRAAVVPELCLVSSVSAMPQHRRGLLGRFFSVIYDREQATLLRQSRRIDKHEAELAALAESQRR